jgi:hypothetical protein
MILNDNVFVNSLYNESMEIKRDIHSRSSMIVLRDSKMIMLNIRHAEDVENVLYDYIEFLCRCNLLLDWNPSNYGIVIFLRCRETVDSFSGARLVEQIVAVSKDSQLNVSTDFPAVVFSDTVNRNLSNTISSPEVVYHSLPWFLLTTYFYFKRYPEPEFVSDPQKILLMMGKCHKPNRIPLLYEMLASGFDHSNLSYSFAWPRAEKNMIDAATKTLRQYLQGVATTNQSYDYAEKFDVDGWAVEHQYNLDGPLLSSDNNFMPRLGLNDTHIKEIYKSVFLELVPETVHNDPWFVTEKTYRPICMKTPFLAVGSHFRGHLASLGFRTFDNYCDTPLLDGTHENWARTGNYHTNDEDSWPLAVKRTVQIAHSIYDQVKRDDTNILEKMREDAEHNYHHMHQLVDETLASVAKIVPQCNAKKLIQLAITSSFDDGQLIPHIKVSDI